MRFIFYVLVFFSSIFCEDRSGNICLISTMVKYLFTHTVTGSTTRGWDSPERSRRQQTPFLVGLDGELVRMAYGKPTGVFRNGGGEMRRSSGGGDTCTGSVTDVWGVVSSESCMVTPGAQVRVVCVCVGGGVCKYTSFKKCTRCFKNSMHFYLFCYKFMKAFIKQHILARVDRKYAIFYYVFV